MDKPCMASAMPDLQLPFQLLGIIAFDWYQFILLGNSGMCVNNLPAVVWKLNSRESSVWPLSCQYIALTAPCGLRGRK